MIQKYWSFEQTTASTVWNINNVPAASTSAVITHVITDTGQILQPESQLKAPDGLQLSFGVTPKKGIAYGAYFVDADGDGIPDEETQTITTGAKVVNITVNQTSGE